MTRPRASWLIAAVLILGACGATSQPADPPTSERRASGQAAVPSPAVPLEPKPAALPDAGARVLPPRLLSCSAEIGSAAAATKVGICRDVSPATHPPCNAANSCAMIDTEIARSCALFADKGAPMAGCAPSPKSMQAAAAVVQRYYTAINAHDYDTAWSQWGDNGQAGQTRAGFEAGFAQTRNTKVTIGPLQPGDGGAGSIYQPVPVTVEATLHDGTRQRFGGEYVVRRVNGVDGASAVQQRWHIGSAQLRRLL